MRQAERERKVREVRSREEVKEVRDCGGEIFVVGWGLGRQI